MKKKLSYAAISLALLWLYLIAASHVPGEAAAPNLISVRFLLIRHAVKRDLARAPRTPRASRCYMVSTDPESQRVSMAA
ncbi:hypothetical protein A9R05_44390 (plasmid) [Burkholderia sp. KK1]|nr:hypothetical protein A9R05_44390 [Burkholderia sp. KK1]